MAGFLEGTIAELINTHLPGRLAYAMVLTRTNPGAFNTATNTRAAPTTQTFNCQGFIDQFSAFHKANSLVGSDASKVVIVTNSLNTTPKDKDVVVPQSGPYKDQRFTVVTEGRSFGIQQDPAGALWEMEGVS